MYKKITIVLLIIFTFIFIGCDFLRNERDAEKLMKYVDCDELYVGTYSGWLTSEYSSLLLQGYENASQVIDAPPLPPERFPVAIFVDIDRNIRVQGLLNEDYSLIGKVNTDGSFEIKDGSFLLSGQFEFDEKTSDIIVSGTQEILFDFGGFGLEPITTLYASNFDISAKCFVSEEILHDLSDKEELDSKDEFYKIRFSDVLEALLKPETKIKGGIQEMKGIEHYQGHGIYSVLCDNFEYDNLGILTPHAVVFVRSCPSKFVINVEEDKTVVFVEEGKIEIKSLDGEKSITLTDGHMVAIFGDHFPEEVSDLYK